ncbi:MAG: type IIL restriction-modification enzyme MmeI [Flavobacteriales bacterium]
MIHPSIRIEGAILSPDLLDRVEEAVGQKPADFGLDSGAKVKDEILRAWADAQDYWRIFQRKLDTLKPDSPATTETRNLWMVPLLGLLGYQLDYQQKGAELNGKTYPLSHRTSNRAHTPVHIIGYREPSGLDRKPERAQLRMSAHAMVQEYINLHDELYAVVSNGRLLRLLRDSSRLVKLTYLEFDLDRIFTDGLFADFAVLYRLLHATRLPASHDAAAECLLERYHQDGLDSGAAIRSGLSKAVESAIVALANGFLQHPDNTDLRERIANKQLSEKDYYQHLLRLIYRLLFLLVIEERDLVYAPKADRAKRRIYMDFYSLQRLRRMAEKRYLADKRKHDAWLGLQATFRLFQANGPGHKLGIAPLAGDLFGPNALGPLEQCKLDNDVLLSALRSLGLYQHPATKQVIRVNYAALNVEEFGSVYEGLLEYEPRFTEHSATNIEFDFKEGDERSNTGSHYTPDDLVQPLIKHSLDHLIAERLREPERFFTNAQNSSAAPVPSTHRVDLPKLQERALLGLRVADIACGSGHILLAAARRIATELAVVRTGEDQPSPAAFREANRDVIRHCIYGVDLNPLAVELCKVALWLEAHVPGEPLNFLDHRIKCGNAIVGYATKAEVDKGVPDEAFAKLPGDEPEVAKAFRDRNKRERAQRTQLQTVENPEVEQHLQQVLAELRAVDGLPEHTPAEVEAKKQRFQRAMDRHAYQLNQLAAIPIAQFYTPKTTAHKDHLITDAGFRGFWVQGKPLQGQATAHAWATAERKRFFHWFIEFPEVMAQGGFDCILGNPPYLGGQALSGTYGHEFCTYVKWKYVPTGLSELVVYFLRRIYGLLKPKGFTAFITTNSIKDGDVRKDGLEQVIAAGGAINFAVRGIRWPGRANLVVSLVGIHKGAWLGKANLDGKDVGVINAYFDDSIETGEPEDIVQNAGRLYQGSIFLGDGFLLTHDEAARLARINERNAEVLFKVINGQELNNEPSQQAQRSIINFRDWAEERAQQYKEPFAIVKELVKPIRATQNRERNRDVWWVYAEHRPGLTRALEDVTHCFASAATTKYLNFSAVPADWIFTHALFVFTTDRWDHFAVVQCTLHEVWARKYSGALKQDLRYSPSKCFDTFPFPAGQWQTPNPALAALGERYHTHRKELMSHSWRGLTDVYNLFHSQPLRPATAEELALPDAAFEKLLGKEAKALRKHLQNPKAPADVEVWPFNRVVEGVLRLRQLHVELDNAVRDAYGWQDLNLEHAFYDVDTLPDNDRTRYTISPAARKEVLKRLLALNHERAAEEAKAGPVKKTTKAKGGDGNVVSEPAGEYRTGLFAAAEDEAEEVDEDVPKKRTQPAASAPDRNRPIGDTEREEVLQTIRQVFSTGGARDRETALRDISQALGYQRLGKNVRATLEGDLLAAVRRGVLENTPEGYRLLARTFDEYHRDHLKASFLSAIGRTWMEREEAIRLLARHLGFARTSPEMQETGRSLINGLIRTGDLEVDGRELVRRVG